MGQRLPDGTWKDSCLDKVKPGEPIFVLRAQDKSAPKVVEYWAELNKFNISKEKHTEALACAEEMRKWPERKVAD